jgi:hypothetical protein
MIARIWHGYTTSENADGYEKLLQSEILPDIERVHRHRAQLLRRIFQDRAKSNSSPSATSKIWTKYVRLPGTITSSA